MNLLIVAKYLLTAIVISLALSGVGLVFGVPKDFLVLFYSAGPFLTAFFYGMDWRDVKLGRVSWSLIALFLPALYFLLPGFVFGEVEFVFDLSVLAFVILIISVAMEEIFWRGFLFEKFGKLGFLKMNLLIGLMWALWHYVPIISGSYGFGNGLFESIFFFTINVILLSFIFGFLVQKSGSILPAIVAHFSHNLILRSFDLPAMMMENGYLLTLVLAVVIAVGCVLNGKISVRKKFV